MEKIHILIFFSYPGRDQDDSQNLMGFKLNEAPCSEF